MNRMNDFFEDFYLEMKKMDFKIKGLLLEDGKILKLSDDSKLLGRIFEMIIEPVITFLCIKRNWRLKLMKFKTHIQILQFIQTITKE